MEITKSGFDYEDLPDSEQRHLERQADKIAEIRGTVARSAIDTGKILAEVHARLANRKTGMFERWVESHGMSPRHARRFIDVADRFADTITGHHVRLYADTALFELAAPSCPAAAVKEAEKIATSGTVITAKLAKSLVEKHKPADNSYTAHGLPGVGRRGKGSRQKRDPAKELEQINRDQPQEAERDEPAESAGAGQPADDRGGVGTAPTAGVFEPSDEPSGEVIDASFTVVETADVDVELALRDALLPLIRMAARLSNDLIKPHVAKCLNDAIDMLSTGEPIEERPSTLPAVVEPEPLTHDVTGEESVMVFAISPGKKGGCEEWGLPQSYVDELQEVFPGVDALSECRKARLWCANNPRKRKTARGMREFLRKWMESEQNRGGGRGSSPPARKSSMDILDEYEAKYGGAA